MTQAAAEWLAERCEAPVAAMYVTDESPGGAKGRGRSGRGRRSQVQRGLSRRPDAVDVLPPRLWWNGDASWTAGGETAMRVVPWSLGRHSGVVVIGPYPADESRPSRTNNVDEVVRLLVAPLAAGLDRTSAGRRATTGLIEAVAHQVGAGLGASPDALLQALQDQVGAARVELVDDRVFVEGARRDSERATAVLARWLPIMGMAEDRTARAALTLFALAELDDARFSGTVGRSQAIGDLAVRIGARLGLDADELAVTRETARLYRVGGALAGMPSGETVRGADPFATDGTRLAAIGASLLAGAGRPEAVVEAVRLVPERWDGLGPTGVAGDGIPMAARITAVAGAWHDLTARRPWSDGSPRSVAARLMRAGSGRQFDPRVVGTLLGEALLATTH